MSAIGLPIGGFVAETRMFETNDRIYHTNYFSQLEVIEAIAAGSRSGWGGRRAEAMPEPVPGARPEPPSRELPMAPPPPGPLVPEAAPPPAAPPPAAPTPATVAAEMPATVVVEETFEVCVTLSRKDIEAGEGMVHAFAKVAVEAERPVSVQVVGKSNAEVIATDSDILGLLLGGGESSVPFTVRAVDGARRGACHRPAGWVPLATLARGEGGLRAALGAPAAPARAQIHTGIDAPELDGLPCLDIIESAQPDGSVIYKYAVRSSRTAGRSPFSPCPSSTVRAPWRHSSTRSSRSLAPT